jgi:hypothetical protein
VAGGDSKAVVNAWFERSFAGDPRLGELLADDVLWWVQPGSPMAGHYRGRDAVLAMLPRAFALYDAASMHSEQRLAIGEGPWVCVWTHFTAKTAKGRDWDSEYVFLFRVERGLIREVREFIDTQRVSEVVFG